MIIFPPPKPFDENKPKPAWYKEIEYYEYHMIKGHFTNRCMKLKNYVQDLINNRDIQIEGDKPLLQNKQLGLYKDQNFLKHDLINQSPNKSKYPTDNINYNKASYTYDVIANHIQH